MRRTKPTRTKRIIWWVLRSAPGFILAVIGLGGVSDDLRQWQEWIISLLEWIDPTTGRYLLVAGLFLAVVPNLPWRYWCSLLFGTKVEAETEEDAASGKVDGSRGIREQILRAAREDYSKEWRGKTRNMLRGALGARYVREFTASLLDSDPEGSGKSYLRSLAPRVDGSFSRAARLERQKESHRLNAAFDMIWELLESVPQLEARFVPAVRQSVVEWRNRCVTTLQELLTDEYEAAWQKVLAALAIVQSQEPDEVRSAVRDGILHLRLIYSKLDDSMLSTRFTLTEGEYRSANPPDGD